MSTIHTAYNVYLNGKLIETVFYSEGFLAEDIRKALISHDGYDSNITVRKQRIKYKLVKDVVW